MINLLYIVSTLKRGGPTNQLFNVISNLDRETFNPIVITLSPEPEDSRWLDYQSLDIEMHSLNLSRLGGLFLAKVKLKSLIAKLQPDLIHTQGIRADGIVSEIKKNTPHIATIHNYPQYDYLMTYGSFKSRFMIKYHISAMQKIDKLIGCSVSVSNNLITNFNLTNVSAIQNGVDDKLFDVNHHKSSWLREKLNLNQSAVIWIATGHLSELKDPLFLINRWLSIKDSFPEHHLVFLGSGQLFEYCQQRKQGIENIHLLGRVSNVVDYLQGSNFFVSASKSEGLPMATIEAMACGLPVLLSDIEPHKEIYNMSPEVGRLFRLGEEHSFLESFKELVESDYSIHRQAALDLIKLELSAVKMSQKYQNIYKQLIGNK
ncbi:glycosyltransferase [Vibrio metschnikovii]|uniref:glycosyltransferase n=1 Tax=Vibrio metschnikovii TaxID=28172 RepID=UPI001C311367|nr:glycosyltransferase [Vibrio metschnikovii]